MFENVKSFASKVVHSPVTQQVVAGVITGLVIVAISYAAREAGKAAGNAITGLIDEHFAPEEEVVEETVAA